MSVTQLSQATMAIALVVGVAYSVTICVCQRASSAWRSFPAAKRGVGDSAGTVLHALAASDGCTSHHV